MPFAKRGDVVHSEATSGFNNQKKSLLINGLAALGDSLYPLHSDLRWRQEGSDAGCTKNRSLVTGFFMSEICSAAPIWSSAVEPEGVKHLVLNHPQEKKLLGISFLASAALQVLQQER